VGCTTISRTKKLEKQIADLQETILKKNEDIKIKEDKLKEEELEANRLRKELERFGVF
jgi:uncharacterized protein (DUF3084 family)